MSKRAWCLVLLLSCYIFYAYIFFNRLFFTISDETRFHPVFIQVSIALVSIVLYWMLSRMKHPVRLYPTTRICYGVGFLFLLGLAVDYTGLFAGDPLTFVCQALACLLFGSAYVLYTVLWAAVYERLGSSAMLVALALSLVVSNVIRFCTFTDIYRSLIGTIVLFALMVASLMALKAASMLLSSMTLRAPREGNVALVSSTDTTEQGEKSAGRAGFGTHLANALTITPSEEALPFQHLTRGVISRMSYALFAIACVALGVGLSWGEEAALSYNVALSLVSALIVLGIVVFLTTSRSIGIGDCSRYYAVAFPLSVLLLLTALLAGGLQGGGVARFLLDCMYYFALALFQICSFAAMVTIAKANGISSAAAIIVQMGVYAVSFTFGKLLFLAFGGIVANTILGVVLLAYLVHNIISLAQRQLDDTKSLASSALESVADAMQESFGLTLREREVLVCLLEGRTYEGVGRKLFISSSTVKTHVRHIYEKMDIGNRDELIELIFGDIHRR